MRMTTTLELCREMTDERGIQHRLLGHAQVIQNPMELKCQLASNGVYCGTPEDYRSERAKQLEAGAADWRLLLQIDTDEPGPGWMWAMSVESISRSNSKI